jgi:hypothetical protein
MVVWSASFGAQRFGTRNHAAFASKTAKASLGAQSIAMSMQKWERLLSTTECQFPVCVSCAILHGQGLLGMACVMARSATFGGGMSRHTPGTPPGSKRATQPSSWLSQQGRKKQRSRVGAHLWQLWLLRQLLHLVHHQREVRWTSLQT